VEGEYEFPVSLGKVARRELAVNGITRFDQLTAITASDLLQIHGLGNKAVRILQKSSMRADWASRQRCRLEDRFRAATAVSNLEEQRAEGLAGHDGRAR